MVKRDRVIQPVSFNLTDNYERELWEYAKTQQKYFSKYVKRLIESDRILKGGRELNKIKEEQEKSSKMVWKENKNQGKGKKERIDKKELGSFL